MDAPQAVIFDIQPFSVHDGPGCRTTIFMSGCPLHCLWCSNPENHAGKPQLIFASKVCKWASGCRACVGTCPKGALTASDNGIELDRAVCRECTTFECVQPCATHSLRICGKYYSVKDVMDILHRDANNWGTGGGVTFSGGDPLLHHDFLKTVLEECKKDNIHTAMETSACIPTEKFIELMQLVDFAFIDVKNMDNDRHIAGTGVPNNLILKNISTLVASGWNGRLVLRYPVIAGYNDSDENAVKVIEFMKDNGLFEINLLKFHRLGQTKWEQLGLAYPYSTGGDVSNELMEHLQSLYLEHDIICYIGDKTPF